MVIPMNEKEEFIKKFSHLFDSSKIQKIESWQDGIMRKGFEPIHGTADVVCTEWLNRLSQVAAMLEHYYIQQKNKENKEEINRPDILKKIDTFFESTKLPSIASDIDDFTQKEGRYITIKRTDSEEEFDCLPDIYGRTIDRISEEQYHYITNQARKLYFQAIAHLPHDKFKWESEEIIVDVDPTQRDNNGHNESGT